MYISPWYANDCLYSMKVCWPQKLAFFLLACFRLSRGKLEKRLETGAHVVVKTHEWTGLISPKTFDEAKELFSHLDWTGIWWRFFWICDMCSSRYDSKYSWLDSWTLIIMIVLGRFGDVTKGETKSVFLWNGHGGTSTSGDVSGGHVVVSVRENFDADPAWMKLRAEGWKWSPQITEFLFHGGCIHGKLWIPVF